MNNTFCVIVHEYSENIETEQYDKCGIDIGVRTFMTVYSPECTYEIGKNATNKNDKYLKKLDKLAGEMVKNRAAIEATAAHLATVKSSDPNRQKLIHFIRKNGPTLSAQPPVANRFL